MSSTEIEEEQKKVRGHLRLDFLKCLTLLEGQVRNRQKVAIESEYPMWRCASNYQCSGLSKNLLVTNNGR
jgi:hypothetical protein